MDIKNDMKISEFKKNIKGKGKFKEVSIFPYFDNHSVSYALVVVLSNLVEEPTKLLHRNKLMAVLLPFKDGIMESLEVYKEVYLQEIKVEAPVFSIFDLETDEKLGIIRKG
jgi:hypothetical protein